MGKKLTIHDKYKNNYFKSADMEVLYEVYPDPWRLNVDGQKRYHRILIEIDRRFPKSDPKYIFEVGSGEGTFTQMLANRYSNAVIYACDISKTAIERANRRNSPRTSFLILDIGKERLPIDNPVDVFILGDVLYYLSSSEEVKFFIGEMERLLKKKGIVILTEFLRTRKYSNLVGERFERIHESREAVHFDISPMDNQRDVTKTYRFIVYRKQ